MVAEFAFEQLLLHRLEICIVPRNRNSRRVMEKLAIREEGIARTRPGDQRRLGGPRALRLHPRGVAHTPHRADARVADAWTLVSVRLVVVATEALSASAFAWRIAVRRFHIFVFQWRKPRARFASLAARHLRITVVLGLPGRPRLVDVGRVESGAHLRRHVRELDVDAMSLAVGVGSKLLFRLDRRFGVAMSLAHCYLLVTSGFPKAVSGRAVAFTIAPALPTRMSLARRARSSALDSSSRCQTTSTILACSAAMRSANQGWRVLHSCGVELGPHRRGMVVDVGHRRDRLLRRDDELARHARGAGGHRVGRREQLVVVDAAVDEADTLGLARRRAPRRTRRRPSPSAARRAGAASTCARRRGAGRSAGSACRTGPAAAGEPHVAAEREVHPGADRRAVHRGERRQRAAGDAQEPLVDRTEALPVGLGEVAEVGAGAERRRRARDDDRPRPTGRPRSRRSAATISATIGAVSVLRRSGLFSVSVPTPSATSVST